MVKFSEQYKYDLPEKLIAKKPASPRDSSRLLVYNRQTGKIFFDKFFNLANYLPKNAVLVFNETKVIQARLTLKKATGGKLKILYLETVGENIKAMSDRKLNVGDRIFLNKKIYFNVAGQEENIFLLKPSFNINKTYEIFNKYGEAPIPPYIKNSPLSKKELKEKYQAIFAKNYGSVAAPTASLHFTRRLLTKIKKAGINARFLTLHVNLGTFAPLTEENLKIGRLHEEHYEISKETADFLNKAKEQGRPIIAVGTTACRALESATVNGSLEKLSGTTDIFIREGYKFKFIDGLITNFHLPGSSLMMLVACLVGRKKLLDIYKTAIAKKFRFYSFGDGMLVF